MSQRVSIVGFEMLWKLSSETPDLLTHALNQYVFKIAESNLNGGTDWPRATENLKISYSFQTLSPFLFAAQSPWNPFHSKCINNYSDL